MPQIELIDTFALAAVVLCWILFFLPFLFRKRSPEGGRERQRNRMSVIGIVIQGLGYAVVWGMRRPTGSAFAPVGTWGRVAFDAVAVVLAAWSVWFVVSAVLVLGKQWSLTARVLEQHELATEGPYRVVRHPIYTAMVLMAMSTGIAVSDWKWTLLAIALAITGAVIRIRIEERLLRESFGEAYDEYARRVPALVTYPRRTRSAPR